ncbi:MAG: GNAT family N-acetyltransferase [Deinococcales bacterium]
MLLPFFAMQESPRSFDSSLENEQKRPLEEIERMFLSSMDARFGIERLVATTGYVVSHSVKTRHKANVYVHPDYRGQGLSRRLML